MLQYFPFAPFAEPVKCYHIQKSLSSTFLACSLLFPSSLFFLPAFLLFSHFLIVGFKLCILSQQPQPKSDPAARFSHSCCGFRLPHVCVFVLHNSWLSVYLPLTGSWQKNVKMPLEQHGRKWRTWWTLWTAAMPTRALCMARTPWLWHLWTLTTTTTDVGS